MKPSAQEDTAARAVGAYGILAVGTRNGAQETALASLMPKALALRRKTLRREP